MDTEQVTVIGGGLAGSEAAFQLAVRGVKVRLVEMRPAVPSPAHHTADLAELVCSNSFKADEGERPSATGMLKHEMAALGSLILACARSTRVKAGSALAVDRQAFSALVTRAVASRPEVELVRAEQTTLPDGPAILATGPLTSDSMAGSLSALIGRQRLSFFDAAAPIVDGTTVDREVCFAASRHGKGGGADYLNCPMDREQYEAFVDALLGAERVHRRDFEPDELFAACQPVEEIARRGRDAPRYGALKPVGLVDPRTGERPHAVLQLRPEDRDGRAYNLVGCQTNLTFPEQARVFRLVPGLESAEFLRWGVMHRNTFVDSPRLLRPDLALRAEPRIRVAGQLMGTEGYLEAAAAGLVAALAAYAESRALPIPVLPPVTALGALLAYATDPDTQPYQPMHVNFGIIPPPVPAVRDRKRRHASFAARGSAAISQFVSARPDLLIGEAVRGAGEAAA